MRPIHEFQLNCGYWIFNLYVFFTNFKYMRFNMKKLYLYISIFITSASLCYSQDYYSSESIYFGMGTSVSSYLGGYFGQAYVLRVFTSNTDYYDDYYNYNYYNTYNYDSYYYDDYTFWSPIQITFYTGSYINEYLAIEAQSMFLFHYNGRVDAEFSSGYNNEIYYSDRNDYANLFAIPLSLCLKLVTPPSGGSSAYLKFGPAMQYTEESYDRIREYYDPKDYYSSYTVLLKSVSKKEWLYGFTTGIGIDYYLTSNSKMTTEIEYSYFNINPNYQTALALDRSPEAQLFSFATKFSFGF